LKQKTVEFVNLFIDGTFPSSRTTMLGMVNGYISAFQIVSAGFGRYQAVERGGNRPFSAVRQEHQFDAKLAMRGKTGMSLSPILLPLCITTEFSSEHHCRCAFATYNELSGSLRGRASAKRKT
jgi:ABC-type thiamine transport system ATPase subunit